MLVVASGTAQLAADRIEAIRAFNRFYTRVIGVLGEGLLDTTFSLTEARVLFELAQREQVEVADVRESLRLDAGYLSRILARFEHDGLVVRARSSKDARRRVVRLTAHGRATFELLDARSTAAVSELVAPLDDDGQRRLLAAMGLVRGLLEGRSTPQPYVLRPPRAGDLGWVVQRHGAVYAEEYGWDQRFEALVARIVADYLDDHDPRREHAWIAEVDGQPAGCVLCVRHDDTTAQLRLLLVEPQARGMGIGTRLVDECLRFARGAGYAKMMLWTNDVLVHARAVYERAGFVLVAEQRHADFGPPLVGQHWERDL